MIKRVSKLEELGEAIRQGEPSEILYGLGEGETKTNLHFTYVDGKRILDQRTGAPPLITLKRVNGQTSVDIVDSDKDEDRYSYTNLTPHKVTFERPTVPEDDLGYLVMNLDEDEGESGKKFIISEYRRRE